MSLDLNQSLHTPHLRGNVGRVPGITAWKASFFWWRVTSVQMVRSGYMEVTGGVTISFLHNIISTSNFLSISLEAQSWALHQQSDRNPLARGHCLKLQCCNYRHCHSGCKTSTRWSSVSTEISTTDPKAFCGKGMKWQWAWGEPCCPLPRRGLEDRESVLGTLCLKTMLWQNIPWRGAISQKQGDQWVKRVGEQQEWLIPSCLDIRGAASLRGLTHLIAEWGHTGGNPRWQCWGTTKVPSSWFLPFLHLFTSERPCVPVSWDILCISKYQMYHWYQMYQMYLRRKGFQRLKGNTLPPFDSLYIRGLVSKCNRNIFWQAQQATVLFCKVPVGFHPGLKLTKTLLIHFVLCSCSNEAEKKNFFLISKGEKHRCDSVLPP